MDGWMDGWMVCWMDGCYIQPEVNSYIQWQHITDQCGKVENST